MGDVTVYGEEETSCFACAPKGMKLDEIKAEVAIKNPLPKGRWTIKEFRVFATGEKQGHECELDSTCRHWYLEAR